MKAFKRIGVSLLVIAMLIGLCPLSCFAAAQSQPQMILVSQTEEFLSDGTRVVISIWEEPVIARGAIFNKAGSKTATGYNELNQALYSFTVSGTFTVNTGVNASCINATWSHSIYHSNWSLDSASASAYANKAIGNATFVNSPQPGSVYTAPITVTLTCNEYGELS